MMKIMTLFFNLKEKKVLFWIESGKVHKTKGTKTVNSTKRKCELTESVTRTSSMKEA